MKSLLNTLFWIAVAYFSYLLLLISLQYIPIQYDVAFLVTKQKALEHGYYKYAFFTHAFTAIFPIVLGIPLFSARLRKAYPQLHKNLGKAYVFIILCLAGPSGLLMSAFANGGIIAISSFIVLSLLWLVFTYKAFVYAKQKNFSQHQAFMVRSYALTLSAITLRLLKWLIANTLHWPPLDTYVVVAWLSWTLNLVIAEIIIYTILPRPFTQF